LAGSEFQIFGAEIRKAREPNSRLHRGTDSRREEEDRRVRTVRTIRAALFLARCSFWMLLDGASYSTELQ